MGSRNRDDGTGGVEPRAFEPRAATRSDDANAFLPDPDGGPAHTNDDLAESLAEGYIASATSGEDMNDEALDQIVPEEIGGPFVETDAAHEFASGTDEANPEGAEVEPLPRAVAGLVATPSDEEDDEDA